MNSDMNSDKLNKSLRLLDELLENTPKDILIKELKECSGDNIFELGNTFYVIMNNEIKEYTLRKNISPIGLETLANVFVIYDNYQKAKDALKQYNNIFS